MPLPYCEAYVVVTNNTDAVAQIALTHSIGGEAVESKQWADVQPGATTSGPMAVNYVLGDRNLDWWWCEIVVNGVTYHSPGTALIPDKECLLESADNGQTLTFTVDITGFSMNMPSGGCSTYMTDGGI